VYKGNSSSSGVVVSPAPSTILPAEFISTSPTTATRGALRGEGAATGRSSDTTNAAAAAAALKPPMLLPRSTTSV